MNFTCGFRCSQGLTRRMFCFTVSTVCFKNFLMSRLDNIIVVDTVEERARKAASVASMAANEVETVLLVGDEADVLRAGFVDRIRGLLSDGKRVMVVFDHVAGVKEGIVDALRVAEEDTGVGTRKILLSCHHGTRLNKGFKKRGVSRKGIRHVRYSMDDGRGMKALDELF